MGGRDPCHGWDRSAGRAFQLAGTARRRRAVDRTRTGPMPIYDRVGLFRVAVASVFRVFRAFVRAALSVAVSFVLARFVCSSVRVDARPPAPRPPPALLQPVPKQPSRAPAAATAFVCTRRSRSPAVRLGSRHTLRTQHTVRPRTRHRPGLFARDPRLQQQLSPPPPPPPWGRCSPHP